MRRCSLCWDRHWCMTIQVLGTVSNQEPLYFSQIIKQELPQALRQRGWWQRSPFYTLESPRQCSSRVSTSFCKGNTHGQAPWHSPSVRLQLSWKCFCLQFSALVLFEMLGSSTAPGNSPVRSMQLIHLEMSLLSCQRASLQQLHSVYAFRLLLQGHKAYFKTSKIQFWSNLVTSGAREPTHESGKMASV